jgi:hypothetical protein
VRSRMPFGGAWFAEAAPSLIIQALVESRHARPAPQDGRGSSVARPPRNPSVF